MKPNYYLIIGAFVVLILYSIGCTQDAQPINPPASSPVVTVNNPDNDLTNDATNDTTPTWVWSSVDGADKYRYSFDEKTWTETSLRTYTSKTVLVDGTYTLYVQAGNDGGWSGSGKFVLKVDTIAPSSPVISGTGLTNNLNLSWSWEVSSDVVKVLYQFNELIAENWTEIDNLATTTYQKLVTAEGSYTFYIKSIDKAGNISSVSSYDTTVDTTAVVVTIESLLSIKTNLSVIPITITFSEEVTGFDLSDVSVDNGTASNFASTDAKNYTADISPVNEGEIIIEIPSNKVVESAGNSNVASNKFKINYDITGSIAIISSDELILTNDSPFTVTVTFNEDVTGFTVDDLRLVNASASNFTATSTKIFTIAITPTADGDLSVDIPADKLTDLAGNSNSASNVFTITYDGTPPTADVTTDVEIGAFTNVSPIKLTVTFNEMITSFAQENVTVVNATITKFQQGFNEMNYKIEITPTDQGEVSLEILANAITDAAGNGNVASNKFSAIYDTIPPVVKEKILASDIIVIENADYVLNQLNFIDEAVELYENDITSDYDDATNKIILTDLAGNISEIANVYDGVDATDGLKYAVETLSDATTDWNDVYMMDGTYDMTSTATSLMVNKAINLYGDYKKTFIDYTGGIDIINVGDVKGKASIKDMIIGSPENTATGITGVGFAIDGNVLEVSGLRTLKSGNLLNVKTYNGGVDPKPNSPYVTIPNGTINCTFFLGDDTAEVGWRKSEYNSNNDQQPTLGGNMTVD